MSRALLALALVACGGNVEPPVCTGELPDASTEAAADAGELDVGLDVAVSADAAPDAQIGQVCATAAGDFGCTSTPWIWTDLDGGTVACAATHCPVGSLCETSAGWTGHCE